MGAHLRTDGSPNDPATVTLGDLLYAKCTRAPVSEKEWCDLVDAIAKRDQLALHALYERSHRLVFTLMMRFTHSRQMAEELTLDVFHDVWRRAGAYDPAGGTVLGWIMNQARSRALDRLRFEGRKKRVNPLQGESEAITESNTYELIELRQQGERLHHALTVLTPDERLAIETAFLSDSTYAEVAEKLNEPLGTIKTRIRSGLSKLRRVLTEESDAP